MRPSSIVCSVADLCYPPVCNLCGVIGTSPPLCEKCQGELERLAAAAACECCGFPLATQQDPCPHCHGAGIAPVDRVARLGVFSDPLRTLVHRIKYRRGWPLAEFLADRLSRHEAAKAMLHRADCVIAVPLHPIRQWSRGYNQAAVIAGRLCKIFSKPLRAPLVRLRNTKTQTTFHAQRKRWENLRDAFSLADEKVVRGAHIVLVDDVMTSGATVHWAAKALQAAGPASISVAALAVADPKGRSYESM